MTKLSFSPFDLSVDDALKVGDKTVTIRHDADAGNPWREFDCQTPVVYSMLGLQSSLVVHDSGDDVLDFFAHVKPLWVSRHWRVLAKLFDFGIDEFDADCRAHQARYAPLGLSQARHDLLADSLREKVALRGWTANTEALCLLADLYHLLGWNALYTVRNGSCQGDSVTILLVATPAHIARCGGGTCASDAALKADADLLGYWAFNEVYGYEIADSTGEVIDSCYGFYGPYYTAGSGILDAIEAMLDFTAPLQVSSQVSSEVSI